MFIIFTFKEGKTINNNGFPKYQDVTKYKAEFFLYNRIENVLIGTYEGSFLHMTKICRCGNEMEVTIRTLKFKKNLEIKNAPVFTCNKCARNELLEQVKRAVITKIKVPGQSKQKEVIYLDKESELSQLLMIGYYNQSDGIHDRGIQQEIQHLMDEILYSEANDEGEWKEKIHETIEKIVQ